MWQKNHAWVGQTVKRMHGKQVSETHNLSPGSCGDGLSLLQLGGVTAAFHWPYRRVGAGESVLSVL
jgi:hypothetical protein